MVWLTWPSPSLLSEWVQAWGRLPSTELALVSDAVRERARRVMLAEGTVDRDGTRHEIQQAGLCASRQEDSRKAKQPARPIPSQGSGVCSVKSKACNTSDNERAKRAGATEASRTLSQQLARATAKTGWELTRHP